MVKIAAEAKSQLGLVGEEHPGLYTDTTTASTTHWTTTVDTAPPGDQRAKPEEAAGTPRGAPQLSERQVVERFRQRREVLRAACRRHGNSTAFRKLRMRTLPLPLYRPVMNLTVSYCPIQKTSSTTWKAIFQSIRREMKARRVPGKTVGGTPGASDVLFAFVREPYGRLLSAYTDKLFSPNTLFWGMTGRYIVANFRRNAATRSVHCGHDVTFPEFVKFFIHMQTTGKKRNGHFIPTHDHCRMCEHPYRYIGHLETILEDMPVILKAMQSPVVYNKSFDNATVMSNARMVLGGMRSGVQRCMGLDEASRRLWKKWQIRGIISKAQALGLTRAQTRNVSLAAFQTQGLAALARSGPKWARVGQKREALGEAFAGVPLQDRLRVRQLLFLDFEMFGFDPNPEEVFPKEPYRPDPTFSYFNLWDD